MQKLKQEIKDKIVKEGMKLFKKNGFQNTSMRDIAKQANISTGNIYRYFINKQKLIDEVLNKVEKEISDFLESIPNEHDKLNHKQTYDLLVSNIVKWCDEYSDEMAVMLNCKDQAQYIRFKEKIVMLLSDKIWQLANGLDEGNVDKVLVGSIANSIFEGLIYIVIKDCSDINKLQQDLNSYVEIMIYDIDKKFLGEK